MRQRSPLQDAIDPQALEARTRAIGLELFARAQRAHAHLSVLNRWTAQVLSWCLGDPQLKANVLRFIDVLPSLRTPEEVSRHVREYFPTSDQRLPAALRVGASLARPGLLTRRAVAAVIHRSVQQVARQFIAESRAEGARQVIHRLAARGALCSLDVLGEQVLSEREADDYVAQCLVLLRESAAAYAALPDGAPLPRVDQRINLSIKPSALTPWFDPVSPPRSLEGAAARLLPLARAAEEHAALLTLDMEQHELRDLTLELVKRLLAQGGEGRARWGVVIQAYLLDAEPVVEDLLAWLAEQRRTLAIRLVKGAYWDFEVAHAAQRAWPAPVYRRKADTDAAFERLTRRLLSAHPLVTTAIASHNVRSVAHAMAAAELLGRPKDQLEFQLLYGMGDALHEAIAALGYPVRIYTPIGELIPGMAYLVRRLLENTSNDSFLRQDYLQERSAEELLRPPSEGSRAARGPDVAASSLPGGGEPPANFTLPAHRELMSRALTRVAARLDRTYPLRIGEAALERSPVVAHNPADPAQELGRVATAALEDVEEAVRRAAAAQPAWAAAPVPERAACLRRAAELMRERRHELAAWEIFEAGKTWREADADVVEAIDFLEYYAEQMCGLAEGRALPQRPGERNRYVYQPRGVAVVISPWNFPAAIVTGMASAALVAGNAVILKPAGPSSIVAAHVADLLRGAGVPADVVQFLPGSGGMIGTALVRHPSTHAVLFTGSRAVGLSIAQSCAAVPPGRRFIKHVVAEMGGKNAILIDADADVDAAILGALHSAFGYGGQKCSAASRLIVHEAVFERVLRRLAEAADRLVVGDPAHPATDLGPLIDASAQQRLQEALAHAAAVGTVAYRYPEARLPRRGWFVGPALVTDVPWTDRLAQEELFGPLLVVFRVKSFEEALELANDTDYALTGGVYSRSPSHIAQSVRAFDVGNLYINRPITGAIVGRQPFGGHRLSGLGTKAGGPDYLLQLLVPRTICENTLRHGMPLE